MEDQDVVHPRKAKALLIVARIFASILALFFLLAIGPKFIGQYFTEGEGLSDGGWEGWVMEITFYVFVIGFAFSWWKKCTGGIILIIASIIQMGPFLIIDGNLGSLIFGVPLLISGVLFIMDCRSKA